MDRYASICCHLLFSAAPLLVGCGTQASAIDDPEIMAQRARYILADEPKGAVGVVEAKDVLKNQDQIVVVGRIGAAGHTPWHAGKAAFMLSDAAAIIETGDHSAQEHSQHHGPGHDHENCPFCSRGKSGNDTLAIVEFLDGRGNVLSIDARKLLGVEQGQVVVVRGRGTVSQLGNLVISADGIYVRN